jgi:threonine/homoserine/homoserine lactone efflux protein
MSGYPALVVLAVIFGGLYVATDSPIAYDLTVLACVIVLAWSVIGLFRRTS